jgi:hypothetical protein
MRILNVKADRNRQMVAIHRPLSRLHSSPLETLSSFAPAPRGPESLTGNEDRTYWLHTRKCLDAAELAINLYALPIPLLQHSPLGISGIALATLANLSACAYVLQGAEWYKSRDRVRLGLGGLKKFGEVWRGGRREERECKKVARAVFSSRREEGASTVGVVGGQQQQQLLLPPMQGYDFQMVGNELTGFEDLGGIDYLAMLENSQVGNRMHS